MSLKARIYIVLVIALGTAVLGYDLSKWEAPHLVRFLIYLALAIPASCLKIKLPGVTGAMSVLFVFLFAGIVDLNLAETIVMAVACITVETLWRSRTGMLVLHLAFNVANVVLATTATGYINVMPPRLSEFHN